MADGSLRVSEGRREPGRGAYACGSEACIRLALAKERLARALRQRIDAAQLEELAGKLAERRAR